MLSWVKDNHAILNNSYIEFYYRGLEAFDDDEDADFTKMDMVGAQNYL